MHRKRARSRNSWGERSAPDYKQPKTHCMQPPEVACLKLSFVQDLGLPVCDRDSAICTDIITTTAFTDQLVLDAPGDKEICLQLQF